MTNTKSAMKVSTIVAKLNFPPGLRPGSSGFVPRPELLAVKPSLVLTTLTCGGGDESCISEFACSDESRLRLEGFGVVSEDRIGLGKAGSPRIIMKVRMFVTKAATMKYIRAWAGCILRMKVE